MRLLGVGGKKGAGKDTFARMLVEVGAQNGVKVVTHAFADKLKVSAAKSLGFKGPDGQLIEAMNSLKLCGSVATIVEHGPYDEQHVTISGRQFLQNYGTEGHRDVFGQDFWVDMLLPVEDVGLEEGPISPAWEKNFDGADLAVVTDVRFPNEAERVRAFGQVLVIMRGSLKDSGDEHASENALPADLVDIRVWNDGSFDELRYCATRYIETMMQG